MKFALTISLAIISLIYAQHSITPQVVDNGGGRAEIHSLVLLSSIGQSVISTTSSGRLSIQTGFIQIMPYPTGIFEPPSSGKLPEKAYLSEFHPNPFNSVTNATIYLPAPSNVKVSVYDITGKRIIEKEAKGVSGTFSITLSMPHSAPSGIYSYIVQANGIRWTGKIAYLK